MSWGVESHFLKSSLSTWFWTLYHGYQKDDLLISFTRKFKGFVKTGFRERSFCCFAQKYSDTSITKCMKSESVSCSVLSDPLRTQGLQPSLPGSSVHGTPQARLLDCVTIPFFRGSSWPMDLTQVSSVAGRVFTIRATRKAHPNL